VEVRVHKRVRKVRPVRNHREARLAQAVGLRMAASGRAQWAAGAVTFNSL
jgi:hypothetical protein